jgi:hypothetical protein
MLTDGKIIPFSLTFKTIQKKIFVFNWLIQYCFKYQSVNYLRDKALKKTPDNFSPVRQIHFG